MEKFLKINPFILIVLAIAPFIILRRTHSDSELLAFILLFTPFLVVSLWYFAVYVFLSKELKKGKNDILLGVILAGIPLAINGIYCYYASYSSFGTHFSISNDVSGEEAGTAQWIARELRYWRFTILIPLWIVLAARTKRYLYARSIGFIMMELIVALMGMLTLGPALLLEKKERSASR